MAERRGPCLKCGKGRKYFDDNRDAEYCNNKECSFNRAIEEEVSGEVETDLTKIGEDIIQELIAENKIPKNWRDNYRVMH